MDGVKVEAAKQKAKSEFKSAGKYLLTFLKWFVLAAVTGAVGGVVGIGTADVTVHMVTILCFTGRGGASPPD